MSGQRAAQFFFRSSNTWSRGTNSTCVHAQACACTSGLCVVACRGICTSPCGCFPGRTAAPRVSCPDWSVVGQGGNANGSLVIRRGCEAAATQKRTNTGHGRPDTLVRATLIVERRSSLSNTTHTGIAFSRRRGTPDAARRARRPAPPAPHHAPHRARRSRLSVGLCISRLSLVSSLCRRRASVWPVHPAGGSQLPTSIHNHLSARLTALASPLALRLRAQPCKSRGRPVGSRRGGAPCRALSAPALHFSLSRRGIASLPSSYM